ncbi:MAG: NAD+ synthase [Thermoplasmatota archaeon]
MTLSKSQLNESIKIIKEFIRDKVDKTNTKGVVLGLSGGLDSSTVLKLCIDALGKEKVHCIIMPESASPEEDMADARWLVDEWDIKHEDININPILESFPVDQDERLAFANLKARVRMCLEYYYANIESSLVVGTSNKSEILLGYTTKFGDSAADFLPIGDVYKTDVRQMAEKIGVPDRFLDKVPRAGLWVGQTDEDELGHTYDEIDKILKGFEKQEDLNKTAEKNGLTTESVEDIKNMVEKSTHKRKLPPIVKLRSRTVGKDWREFNQ